MVGSVQLAVPMRIVALSSLIGWRAAAASASPRSPAAIGPGSWSDCLAFGMGEVYRPFGPTPPAEDPCDPQLRTRTPRTARGRGAGRLAATIQIRLMGPHGRWSPRGHRNGLPGARPSPGPDTK